MAVEYFNHHIHNHTLTLTNDSNKKIQESICKCCGKPAASSEPSYTCAKKCNNLIIHQKCAELPREIKHPMHSPHPLNLAPDRANYECNACGQPLRASAYECSVCEFYLDVSCAFLERTAAASSLDENPVKIEHPMHSQHSLVLLAKPPYPSGSCRCQVCKKPCSDFVYHCSSINCEFDIHTSCAVAGELIQLIPTHNHPVRLMQRPASFRCNGCDEIGFDESYLCTISTCGFWIHKGCGSFPQMFKREDHDHPLSLAISLPVQYQKYEFTCEVCHKELRSNLWLYYCGKCRYFVHFKCITADVPEPKYRSYMLGNQWYWRFPDKPDISFVGFPDKPDICLPDNNLVEKLENDRYDEIIGQSELPDDEVRVESHKHSLLLSHHRHVDGQQEKEEIICDGCIESIININASQGSDIYYYKCGHDQCNFFLHVTCANLPMADDYKHNYFECINLGGKQLKLCFPENAREVVKCSLCKSFCSGYSYKCSACGFCADVKCLSLVPIEAIKHKGHRHLLVDECGSWNRYEIPQRFICNACGVSGIGHRFSCYGCNYDLGYECATLPATVKHRWDEHDLILRVPPFTDIPDEFYCEVCEEEIHPKLWIYRCAQCDQSFHPSCIPTLGASRNIKFGRTLTIQRHQLPLVHVPEGNLTSRCDNCHKLLYWQRVFECAPCRFYLCIDCIAKEPIQPV